MFNRGSNLPVLFIYQGCCPNFQETFIKKIVSVMIFIFALSLSTQGRDFV